MMTSKDLYPSARELKVRAVGEWFRASAHDGAAVRACLTSLADELGDDATLAAVLRELSEHVPAVIV